jgi:hypothetical protein
MLLIHGCPLADYVTGIFSSRSRINATLSLLSNSTT